MQDVLIFTTTAAPKEKIQRLREEGAEVEIVDAEANHLNLSQVLKTLAARSILSVLVEAGTHLNAALLREDLADKVILFRAPTDLGVGSVPFAENLTRQNVEQRLTRVTRAQYGLDTCTTGYLHYPWA